MAVTYKVGGEAVFEIKTALSSMEKIHDRYAKLVEEFETGFSNNKFSSSLNKLFDSYQKFVKLIKEENKEIFESLKMIFKDGLSNIPILKDPKKVKPPKIPDADDARPKSSRPKKINEELERAKRLYEKIKRSFNDSDWINAPIQRGTRRALQTFARFQKETTNIIDSIKNYFKAISIGGMFKLGMDTFIRSTKQAFQSVFVDSVKVFEDFQATMAQVGIKSGATGQAFDSLKQKALELGSSTAKSSSQVAAGMMDLSAAGLTALEINNAIEPILQASIAGQVSVAKVSSLTVATIKSGFKDMTNGFDDTTRALDMFQKASNMSMMSLEQFERTFPKMASSAASANQTLATTITAQSMLRNSGETATKASFAVRGLLESIVSPSMAAEKAFAALGLSTEDFRDKATGAMKDLPDILQKLQDQADSTFKALTSGKVNDAIAEKLGRSKGLKGKELKEYAKNLQGVKMPADQARAAVDGLLKTGLRSTGLAALQKFAKQAEVEGKTISQAFKDFRTDVIDSEKESANAAKKMEDTWWGMRQNLQSAFEGLQLQVGETLTSELVDAGKALTVFLRRLKESGKMERFAKNIAGAIKVLAPMAIAFAEGMIDVVSAVAEFVKENPLITKIALSFAGLFSMRGAILGFGGSILSLASNISKFGVVGSVVGSVGNSFGQTGAQISHFLLTNPAGWAIGVGVAFAALALKIYNTDQKMKEFNKELDSMSINSKNASKNLERTIDIMQDLNKESHSFISAYNHALPGAMKKSSKKSTEAINKMLEGINSISEEAKKDKRLFTREEMKQLEKEIPDKLKIVEDALSKVTAEHKKNVDSISGFKKLFASGAQVEKGYLTDSQLLVKAKMEELQAIRSNLVGKQRELEKTKEVRAEINAYWAAINKGSRSGLKSIKEYGQEFIEQQDQMIAAIKRRKLEEKKAKAKTDDEREKAEELLNKSDQQQYKIIQDRAKKSKNVGTKDLIDKIKDQKMKESLQKIHHDKLKKGTQLYLDWEKAKLAEGDKISKSDIKAQNAFKIKRQKETAELVKRIAKETGFSELDIRQHFAGLNSDASISGNERIKRSYEQLKNDVGLTSGKITNSIVQSIADANGLTPAQLEKLKKTISDGLDDIKIKGLESFLGLKDGTIKETGVMNTTVGKHMLGLSHMVGSTLDLFGSSGEKTTQFKNGVVTNIADTSNLSKPHIASLKQAAMDFALKMPPVGKEVEGTNNKIKTNLKEANTVGSAEMKTLETNIDSSAKGSSKSATTEFGKIKSAAQMNLYQKGLNAVSSWARGFLKGAFGGAAGLVQKGFAYIRSYMHSSEPKNPKSPLRGLTKSGEMGMSFWAKGVENSKPMLDRTIQDVFSVVDDNKTISTTINQKVKKNFDGPKNLKILSSAKKDGESFLDHFTGNFIDKMDLLKTTFRETFAEKQEMVYEVKRDGQSSTDQVVQSSQTRNIDLVQTPSIVGTSTEPTGGQSSDSTSTNEAIQNLTSVMVQLIYALENGGITKNIIANNVFEGSDSPEKYAERFDKSMTKYLNKNTHHL